MSTHTSPPSWWGAPKKFNPNFEERRISWLELFYDLVYVIAISRITHMLCNDLSITNFFWYCSLFILIFWGWLNGSQYHDIHGNIGLRTRLMTLWQMIIISAISVSIDHSHGIFSKPTTITLMIMQLFITYLWWSVGFYDKEHRKYNKPYTLLYLTSFLLMGLNMILPATYRPILILFIILFNYTPPFISSKILRSNALDLSLSSSMAERLGLFTIIVFGEVVLGVVNGVSAIATVKFINIVASVLSLAIVFSMWWIFFTLISNRNAQKGFSTATFFEILYVPTLISLGLIATSFTLMFHSDDPKILFTIICFALAVFAACIAGMMGVLVYPDEIKSIYKRLRLSLFITSIFFIGFAIIAPHFTLVYFLLIILVILLAEIVFLNSIYYSSKFSERRKEIEANINTMPHDKEES